MFTVLSSAKMSSFSAKQKRMVQIYKFNSNEEHWYVLNCIAINTIVSFTFQLLRFLQYSINEHLNWYPRWEKAALRQQLFKTPLNQHITTKRICSHSAGFQIFYYMTTLETLRLAFSESLISLYVSVHESLRNEKRISYPWLQYRTETDKIHTF